MGNRRFAQVSTSDDEDEAPPISWTRKRSSSSVKSSVGERRSKRIKLRDEEEEEEIKRVRNNKRKKSKEESEEEDPEEDPEEEEEPQQEDAKPVGEVVRVSGKGRERRSHFKGFEFDGNRYELEDPVLLVPEDQTQKPYVAIIKDITQTKDGSIMVLGQWFYHPEKAERKGGGNWQSRDSRELFYSFHRDEVPAESVMHKCVVHFIPLHKQIPHHKQHPGFIVQKVYDSVERKLWKLTDKDYEDNKQHEIDLLVQKTLARLGDLPNIELEDGAIAAPADQEDSFKGKRTQRKRNISPIDISRDEDASKSDTLKPEPPGSCINSEFYNILLKFDALTGDSHRDKCLERLLHSVQYMCNVLESSQEHDKDKAKHGVDNVDKGKGHNPVAYGSEEKSAKEGESFCWPDGVVHPICALEKASHDSLYSDFQKYDQKLRQLVFNLKNNSILARCLLKGELEPLTILNMSLNELKEGYTTEETTNKEPADSNGTNCCVSTMAKESTYQRKTGRSSTRKDDAPVVAALREAFGDMPVADRSVYMTDASLTKLRSKLGFLRTKEGVEQWMLVPVGDDDRVCSSSRDGAEEFFMCYEAFFTQIKVTLPFSEFEMTVLKTLNVAPIQLGPNAWAYVRMLELVCSHFRLHLSPRVLLFFFHPQRAPIQGGVYLHPKQFRQVFDPFQQSVRNYRPRFMKVVWVGNGDALYKDGDKTKFPLYWTKGSIMLSKMEFGQLEAAEAKTVLYLLSMKYAPKGVDLLTLEEPRLGEFLNKFIVPVEELLVDLRGGLTIEGACDSKGRIVKKKFVMSASGHISLFTSAYKQEKSKAKDVDIHHRDDNDAVVRDGEEDAPVQVKFVVGSSRVISGSRDPINPSKGSKRKIVDFENFSKKHKKKKSKRGMSLEVLSAATVMTPSACDGSGPMEGPCSELASSVEVLKRVGTEPSTPTVAVDQTTEVGPSLEPVRPGDFNSFDPAANVDWCTTIEDIFPKRDMERLRQLGHDELANASISECIKAVMRVRTMQLNAQQQEKTLERSEKKYARLLEREKKLSNQVSEQKAEMERLKKALEAAYIGEQQAIGERGQAEAERDQAMIEKDSMTVALAEAKRDVESLRKERSEYHAVGRLQEEDLRRIREETWHNCLQQVRLKHGGLSVRDLNPDCVVVGGKLVHRWAGLVPDDCDRNYPTDSSSVESSGDDSSSEDNESQRSNSSGRAT